MGCVSEYLANRLARTSAIGDSGSFRRLALSDSARKAARLLRKEIREREARLALLEEESLSARWPDDSLEGPEKAEAVHRALDLLPTHQREILTLFYLEGLDLTEIAEIIGSPLGTVKSRLHSARLNIRRIIEKENS
jgi:RNA polymerase sigma-70 factor, ECF subfamily